MDTQGNSTVWFIIIPIFLGVGIHLLFYSRKRRALLKGFALKNGLRYLSEDNGRLESELSEKLAIEDAGMRRSFMALKDIITHGDISVFRCIELLDLNPYRRASITHCNHVCASFDVPSEISLFFLADKERNYHSLYPKDKNIEGDPWFQKIRSVLESRALREGVNSISLTLRNGKALLYLNPFMVGGEKEEDIAYLFSTSEMIKNAVT